MEGDQPTEQVRQRITRAVEDAQSQAGEGKVVKVLFTDEKGEPVGQWASNQIPEDPFSRSNISGLVEPPFPLAQLVYLAETHPVHSAALEQKTVDICGGGWEWEAKDPDVTDDVQRDEVSTWFDQLSPDEVDMKEVIYSTWLDVETTGWGLMELVRDPGGILRKCYPVPAHTVRAHKNGFSLCQIRDSRKVWFRRWGAPDLNGKRVEVDSKTGSITTVKTPASDLFVVRKPARRSTWYGIPGYISSVGWITLALAARDDNLYFFANRREPRWAIVLTNLAEDPDLENDLRRAFTVDLRQPHRNILVPITGPGKVDFQKLSDNRQEGSFDRLSERADKAIMISHRVPAERLANSQVGPLGGNATFEASKVYKEGVVGPSQELLQNRLNRLLDIEYAIAMGGDKKNPDPPVYKLVMDDLDTSSDAEDLEQTVTAFKADLISLKEARHRLKLDPLEFEGEGVSDLNDMLWSQLPGTSNYDDAALGVPPTVDTAALDSAVKSLLLEARDTRDRIEELARGE
jgi:capsid portal protein